MIESIPLYELWKVKTVALLGINADAVHIYAGVVSFLFLAVVYRKQRPKLWMLIPGLLASLLIEVLDYHYWMQTVGYFEWQKSLLDILNTNLLPFILFVLLRGDLLPKRQLPVQKSAPTPLDLPY